jgi:predicted GNAT family acetyltransferase
MEAEIIHNAEESRYEIRVDGRLAGFLAYERAHDVLTFTHLETDLGMAGRGLGLALTRGSLDAAGEGSLSVVPREPFVRDFIARHPVYLDLVPPGARAELDLPAE